MQSSQASYTGCGVFPEALVSSPGISTCVTNSARDCINCFTVRVSYVITVLYLRTKLKCIECPSSRITHSLSLPHTHTKEKKGGNERKMLERRKERRQEERKSRRREMTIQKIVFHFAFKHKLQISMLISHQKKIHKTKDQMQESDKYWLKIQNTPDIVLFVVDPIESRFARCLLWKRDKERETMTTYLNAFLSAC